MKKLKFSWGRWILGLCLALMMFFGCSENTYAAIESFYWPVPTVTKWTTYKNHTGIDIQCGRGTLVYAAKSGKVVKVWNGCSHDSAFCGCNDGFGNGVVIRHDDGTWTEYAHMQLNSIVVKNGAWVEKGAELGKSASSGSSTGPHLHFGIRQGSGSVYGHFWGCKVLNADPNGGVVTYDSIELPKLQFVNATVSNLTDTTAFVKTEIINAVASNYSLVGLTWGTSQDMPNKIEFPVQNILTFVSVAFDGSEGPTLTKGTTYYYRYYVVGKDGTVYNDTEIKSFTTTGDSQNPVISNVQISDVTSDGYTVECTVTDNSGVQKVCYPSWTEKNNQDDLQADWGNVLVATQIGTNQYKFRVNTSDHNNEIGKYITHIYAYDNSGNQVNHQMSVDVPAPIVKPATPAKPYKIANTVSGIHVYWKATNGISKYALWRSESGTEGSYTKVAETSAVHYTDTKVVSGKTYYYKVTNYDTANKLHSDMSEAIVTTFVSTPDITKRENLSAGIKLTWNKSEGATGYAIYRKVGSESWGRVKTISGNSTFTWIDTSVKDSNGTTYKYTIRALAGSDKNILSGCRNTGRTMVRLTSRTMTQVKKTAATSVICKWMTTAQAAGYEVRFMVGDTKYKQVTIGNYKTGTKTITGIKAGQTYKVQVRSYKKVTDIGSFYSAWSTPMYVTM